MHATRLHIKCIFFFASLSVSYPKHISFYVEDIKRILAQREGCNGVCMTPECVKTAARILSFLDESVDPCKNFYRFACGGWLSNPVFPQEPDLKLGQDIRLNLKALIEKQLDGTEPAFVKMLKDAYDACMDFETVDKLRGEPLKKDLSSLGGWPVVEGSQWNESSFDWVDTLIAFRRLGYDFDMLIDMSVVIDKQNKTTNIIKLDSAILGMDVHPQRYIRGLNNSEVAADYKMGVKEAVLLGANEDTAQKELLEALQFKIELANILPKEDDDEDEIKKDVSGMYNENAAAIRKDMLPKRDRKTRERRDAEEEDDETFHSRYTVTELQEMIPEIPWIRYFNGLLNDEIQETETIVVSDPVFLKKLANLLKKTEKRVVANYIFWRMVDQSWSYLSRKWRDTDPGSEESQRNDCFIDVQIELTMAVNSYYVRHFFKEDSKEAVMELVKYIHKEFLCILEEADWMDDLTRKEAMEKANSMKAYIGYPQELVNDTVIMKIYENLTISKSNYYENVKNIRKWRIDNKFSSLRKLNIEVQWEKYAEVFIINACYRDEENSIEFPAATLQGVYFHKDRPHYLNFGAIGYLIGHEITHGFDVRGKKFDKNRNKVDWWDKTTDEQFHKRVQCMIEQYSNYTLESGVKLNGVKTQDEDIADNGGLKEAYRAYHSWVKNNGPEPLLPGMKYTQDQLFWISFAQTYCQKNSVEALENIVLFDEHSPPDYRVIGSVSNLAEFSKDFNCPSDSPMNRKNKCHVW